MKQITLLRIAVAVLLLTNAICLYFVFSAPHPAMLGDEIARKLHLDAAQQQQFNSMKSAHHQLMEQCDRDFRSNLEAYFAQLKADTPDSPAQDSLLLRMSAVQRLRIRATFDHFRDIKTLCTPEQQREFADLYPELMELLIPRKPRHIPPPGK